MRFDVRLSEERAAGREEGREEGAEERTEQISRLYRMLVAAGRADEFAAAMDDRARLSSLLLEFRHVPAAKPRFVS